ncbi:MAG: hypothetical protein KDD94_08790 [Calditrichaeota bacterium]|nr:hypothetical protein [Calditrichota bacterium]
MNQSIKHSKLMNLLIGGLFLFTSSLLSQVDPDVEIRKLLPEAEEIKMALSAAPAHLRDNATVYVWKRGGYVKVREGTNGFNCMVLREGTALGPICYDPVGSATTMIRDFRWAKLIEDGKTQKEAKAIIAGEYESGKLKAPDKYGIAYMLSPNFTIINPKSGERVQAFPPHIMFYAPYMKPEDAGLRAEDFQSRERPWLLRVNDPRGYIIVVPNEGVFN